MKKIFLTFLIFITSSAFAQNEHCTFKGMQINVGESVWVEVPQYINSIENQMIDKGYSQDEIDNEVRQSDHTGHRLYCTKAYSLADPKGEAVSEILTVTSYVLVDRNPYRGSRDFPL